MPIKVQFVTEALAMEARPDPRYHLGVNQGAKTSN